METPLTSLRRSLDNYAHNTGVNKKVIFLLLAILISHLAFSQKVYVTRTGEKYHASGCRYLSKSKIEATLADAKEKGYTACSVCKPTTTVSRTQSSDTTNYSPVRKVNSTQCTGTTKAGRRCLRMTTSASGRCYQH